MNCSKACQEIYIHFCKHYLYEGKLYFMIRLDDEDYSSQINIPKGHLSPEICKNLLINIQLKGPSGQTHEINTKSTEDMILLATGWKDFISYYSLRRKDVLLFFYEGNGLFVVNMFNQNGLAYNAEQMYSRGTDGKGKQLAESEPSAVSAKAKSGWIEHNSNIIFIDSDSEESRDSVKERKQTPPENKEISDRSAYNFTQLSNHADVCSSRSVADASEGPSRDNITKEKDVSVELAQANEMTSDTEDESWSSDSVYEEILAQPRLPRDVISISSGSFHDNVYGVKSQYSPNLRVKKEPDNSENSDSDQVTTKCHANSEFTSRQKPTSNKERSSTASDQAARFRSRNPYFAKQIVVSNVRGARRLNVFLNCNEVLPRKAQQDHLAPSTRKQEVESRVCVQLPNPVSVVLLHRVVGFCS